MDTSKATFPGLELSMPTPLMLRGKHENMLIRGFEAGYEELEGYLLVNFDIGEVFNAEFWFAKTAVG